MPDDKLDSICEIMDIDGEDFPPAPVDVSLAGKGVWLVKVPKYISEQWKGRRGETVGRLSVTPSNVLFTPEYNTPSSAAAAAQSTSSTSTSSKSSKAEAESMNLAKEQHDFITRDVPNQTLVILSEDKTELYSELATKSGRVSVDGRVVKRAECRPPASQRYLGLKARQMHTMGQPVRTIKQLDKAEVKYKPVDVHREEIARRKEKKDGAKAVRLEKSIVVNMIFEAFEKHQYYRLADLQNITQQPPGYIKELLSEYAIYNSAPPHKSMWELKAEYRAYAQPKKGN